MDVVVTPGRRKFLSKSKPLTGVSLLARFAKQDLMAHLDASSSRTGSRFSFQKARNGAFTNIIHLIPSWSIFETLKPLLPTQRGLPTIHKKGLASVLVSILQLLEEEMAALMCPMPYLPLQKRVRGYFEVLPKLFTLMNDRGLELNHEAISGLRMWGVSKGSNRVSYVSDSPWFYWLILPVLSWSQETSFSDSSWLYWSSLSTSSWLRSSSISNFPWSCEMSISGFS